MPLKNKEVENAIDNLISFIEIKASSVNRPGGLYMNRQEKRMAKKIDRLLKEQMNWLADSIRPLFPEGEKGIVRMIEKKSLEDDIQRLLIDMPNQADIAEIMAFYAGASMVRGGNYRIKKMKIGNVVGTFNLLTPEVRRYIENLKDLQLSDFRGSISFTTKQNIKKILIKGGLEGASYTRMASEIMKQGEAGVFSFARSQHIAVREVGLAFGEGQHEATKKYIAETGAVVEKKWQTFNDPLVRDTHFKNQNDGWIPFEDYHSGTNELYAPSEIDFNCRCVENYRTI